MLNRPVSPNTLARTELAQTEYHKCIEWLYFPGYDARERLITAAHPGTCNWMFENEGFGEWVQSNKNNLWIKGKPGSGKSIIMKHLFDLIRSEKSSGMSNVFPLYAAIFFNARGSSLETSCEGLLRSSIMQILQQKPKLFDHIQKDYLGVNGKFFDATLIKMMKILVRECSLTSRLCLLVDAIDECNAPVPQLLQLFEELIQASRERGFPMSICVSGRPVHTLTAWLGHYAQLTLEDHTSDDIATFVFAKTSCLSSARDAYIYEEFQQDIMEKSNGIFFGWFW